MNNKLNQLITQLQKNYGKETINISSSYKNIKVSTVSSGSFILDNILGGGYPRGRVIEIFGPAASGKTTMTLHAISSIQKNNEIAAFIDVENALDMEYAKTIGVNVDDLIISQPNHAEQAFSIIEDLIKSNVVGLIVIDSVAALVPEAELKGEISDNTIALQARLMSKALRRLTNMINKNNIIIIFINQLREKVGVIFGNPEITPGGRSLKFYASQRIEIRKSQNITVKGEITGITVKAKVVKNKINVPFKKAVIEILFNGGISINNEYINIAIENNIILQNGS